MDIIRIKKINVIFGTFLSISLLGISESYQTVSDE